MRMKIMLVTLALAGIVLAPGAPLARAAGPDLRVDEVGFTPAAYDPAIPEYPRKDYKNWDFGNPDLGGIWTIVVANDGDEDATVSGVTIGGEPLADFLAGTCQLAGLACQATPPQEMAWARWLPTPVIPAGGAAAFQLKRTTAPSATTVAIDAGTEHVDAVLTPDASPIRLGLVYRDGDDVVVIVRNDGGASATLQGVSLDGASVAAAALGGQTSIAPGRTGILRVPDVAPAEGSYAVITVRTSRGDATAALRVFTPFFPIGSWFGDGWSDPAFLDDAKAHHIDTSWGYDWTVPIAREYGFKLIADAVPCVAGQTSGCIREADEDLVAAFAYGDEVEFGHSAQDVMANLERRRTESDRPTYINNAAQRVFQVFAAQADVGSMDHYTSAIGLCTITTAQPASMQGQPVEWAGNYTRYLKLNVEPSPAWVWSQAANNRNKTCWHGLPTVGEMRAQLFSELANGAKGITWFIFGGQAQIDAKPALWDEAGDLGATLVVTRDRFSRGDLDPGALRGASADLEVGVVSAPDAVMVSVLDLRYRLKPKGYVWGTRSGVEVSVALPAWLASGSVSVSQVRAGVSTTVPFTRSGSVVTATLPSLHVGTVVVIEPDN